jgi:DNA end-binding protein Ku
MEAPMARPIWTGNLSFGLLNIPVSLMAGERRVDLHFRMMDGRNKAPIRYERVNAETGEEVPWKQIVKAFEYKKGSYVVLEPEDIQSAASDNRETVEVQEFVDAASIGAEYFEKPYVLVPGKKAQKGYVLLRETLKRSGKAGIAKVVIRGSQGRRIIAAAPALRARAGGRLRLSATRREARPLPDFRTRIVDGRTADGLDDH